jgi:hypothetical protein
MAVAAAEMKCRIDFVDFEGRTDMVSMATLLAEVNARQLVRQHDASLCLVVCGTCCRLVLAHGARVNEFRSSGISIESAAALSELFLA